jgi:hypothetical protein
MLKINKNKEIIVFRAIHKKKQITVFSEYPRGG